MIMASIDTVDAFALSLCQGISCANADQWLTKQISRNCLDGFVSMLQVVPCEPIH